MTDDYTAQKRIMLANDEYKASSSLDAALRFLDDERGIKQLRGGINIVVS